MQDNFKIRFHQTHWGPVGNEGGVPEGVVQRGINRDKPSDTSVEDVGKNHLEDLRGQGSAGGGGVGYDDFPPKREGGASGDRDRRGGLEGMHNGG